ncbi:MAG: GNAT family N-acetyltransferase [Eubacteriales bacterium]|nr:GNAT family N-acetyltransferase [Eubacteriales bacterium]
MKELIFNNHLVILDTVAFLDSRQQASLKTLMDKCDGYEPYYTEVPDSSVIMFTASCNSQLIGFLSLLFTQEDTTGEITALVTPDYRKKGVFSALKALADEWLLTSCYNNYSIIGSIPQELVLTGFYYARNPVFTEYLLKLTYDDYMHTARALADISPFCTDTPNCSIDISNCEFGFSDDNSAYLMYDCEDACEPCALLNIAYGAAFSNIYGVWVDTGLRRRGAATALMCSFFEDYFCEPSTPPLVLNVRSTNTAAFKLYKKCGFTEVSHISYYSF